MSITQFTPIEGILGGILIGIATAAWLWLYGRVTGISGILGGLVLDRTPGDRGWQAFYLAGLIIGGVIYLYVLVPGGLPGAHFHVDLQIGWPWMLVAGLLTGFGTRMGHGCTSGHGVCGLARLSPRSLVAVITFLLFAFLTTFMVRHVVRLA